MGKNSLPILYEDSDLLVINKPANLLVDPTSPWLRGTSPLPAKYLVHRLDRNTTGALILAKNPKAQAAVQKQFKDREVKKTYWLITFGQPKRPAGTITSFISRNPKDRTKRQVELIDFGRHPDARLSVTGYRTLDQKQSGNIETALIEADLKTGRTHQLRAQFKSLGSPILGDPDYTTKPAKRFAKKLGIDRQLLHARAIAFFRPRGGKLVKVGAPLPADFTRVLDELNLKANNKTSDENKT